MEANDDIDELEQKRWFQNLHFDWLFKIFIRPRRTLGEVVSQGTAAWLLPLVLLTVLSLVYVRASGLPRRYATNITDLPPDYEYYSPEQQAQFQQAVAARQSRMFVYGLPALGEITGIWVGWVLLGSALHLSLTLNGSRSSNKSALNLAAWAMMPLGLRYLVRTAGVLSTQQLISSPGISGFLPSGSGGLVYLSALAGKIDLFIIWMVVLLLIGSRIMSGLSRGRAWLAAGTAILAVWLLSGVIPYATSLLGGLETTQGMFFF